MRYLIFFDFRFFTFVICLKVPTSNMELYKYQAVLTRSFTLITHTHTHVRTRTRLSN
jgi:hypothetical protein